MKKIFVRLGLLCTITLLLATCNKIDWDFTRHQGKNDCDVQSFYLSIPNVPHPFLFEKKYNAAGSRVTEITFNFFSLSQYPSPIRLRLVYQGLAIYMVNVENPGDTTMKVYLNSKGRVKECFGKLRVDYTRFYYNANDRVSSFDFAWGGLKIRNVCEYDQFGNILRIVRDDAPGERFGTYYEYDYSRKGKRQFYRDAYSDNDDFTLLHYLGFFPELEPVHVRTYTWMGIETSPFWYNQHLTNHKFDSKGRLIQYDLVHFGDDTTYLNFQAFVNWKCK